MLLKLFLMMAACFLTAQYFFTVAQDYTFMVSLLGSRFGLAFRNKIFVSRICFLLGSHSFKGMPSSSTITILCLTIIICSHFQSQWLHVEAATDCWKCGEMSNHIKLSRKKKEEVHSLMRKIKTLLNHAEHLKISKNKR